MSNKTVVVGLSGGVDSSVTAYLLKEKGYNVIGVTMQMCDAIGNEMGIADAAKVAEKLGIPHFVLDFRHEFKENVIDYFMEEYKAGRTPNPCVRCNRTVKWEALLKRAKELGADYIATGHYAKIEKLENGRFAVKNCVSSKKDQTYALCKLTQEQLSKTIMPLGDYSKEQIRQIAENIGIEVANKPDSMEICFIPDNDYAGYIKENTGYEAKPGNMVDVDGNIVGEHKGIIHYTVGQRKGLGVALGRPVFVVAIRPDTNEVVLGDNSDVFATKLYANKVNLMGIGAIDGTIRAKAKIRYSHNGAMCSVRFIDDDTLECIFDEPQRAITPGQALVLYDDDTVIAGATIIGSGEQTKIMA